MSEIVATADAPQQARTAAVAAVVPSPSDAQTASRPISQAAAIAAEVPIETPAGSVPTSEVQTRTLAPDVSVQATDQPPPDRSRPMPKTKQSRRERPHRKPAHASAASSRATTVAHNSHADTVTGSVAAANYRAIVAAELNRRKFYPASARSSGIEGVVVVSFTVGSAGTVIGKTIVRSAEQPILDDAARQIMATLSLPTPPGGTFRATVPTQFDMRH